MDLLDAMRLIAAKSPNATHAALLAFRALQNNSPLGESRAQRAIEVALRDRESTFTTEDRSSLALLFMGQDPNQEEEPRTLDLRIRVNADEKQHVKDLADEAGLSVSNFIRQRVGLPTVD